MRVVLYSLSTCPYCRMAKRFLDDCGIDFDVTEVDQLGDEAKSETVADVRRLSGGASFPVIVVGDEVVVGFDKARLSKLLGL